MQELLESMTRRVVANVDGYQPETRVPRLGLAVIREPQPPEATLFPPLVSIVLQGEKELVVGDRTLTYGPAACFCSTIDLHSSGCVVAATPERPYVTASLTLDQDGLAELLASLPEPTETDELEAFAARPASLPLLEAFDHLIALLDTPDDVAPLGPAREREVLYRLLQDVHGPMLRQFAYRQSRLMRVKRAIDWIKLHFDERLTTEQLAQMAAMSVPTFHRHFKETTAMTPLQYQKAIRLEAARRLLLANPSVAHAAYAVGYESPSQFSREYTRFFRVRPSKETRGVSRVPLIA